MSNSERRVVPDTLLESLPFPNAPSSTIDSKSKDQEVPGENALLELSEAMKPHGRFLLQHKMLMYWLRHINPVPFSSCSTAAITAMLPAVEAYFALADALAPDQLEEVSKKMAEKQQERDEVASLGNADQTMNATSAAAVNRTANNTPMKLSQPSRASTPGLLRASSVKFTSNLGLDALLENTTVADELKSRLSTEAWKFAERHRSVINALLRRNPQLLTTSLKTLLRTPRVGGF